MVSMVGLPHCTTPGTSHTMSHMQGTPWPRLPSQWALNTEACDQADERKLSQERDWRRAL